MRHLLIALLAISFATSVSTAQKLPISYYLPEMDYDPAIPTPESFLGYQIGEWHISHDQQYAYMKQLAALSPRITLTEYARSYENRPLVYLTITSPANHTRLGEIQAQHRALCEPAASGGLDLEQMPVVIYQGCSIHGNEPSGANAAPLIAYYLAAARGPAIDRMLSEMVILLDPSFNPDGLTRFSSWVNMHKNKNLSPDPDDREYNEAWPRGRTNHYWFDLNRDWLPVQHPESRGRVNTFHEWKPNVLTDHHEMGTNSTFFFMPGEPTRVHPLTPKINQELTVRIARYHAAALDKIGSLYYTQERYDDFYYGKGSTYPDVNGCVGILFEQASSRGHLQETDNGLMSFAFTIRNQVTTALSTQKAALDLRKDLLEYQRSFYQQSLQESRSDVRKAFVFGEENDPSRTFHLVDILQRHRINVHRLGRDLTVNNQAFRAGSAYIVPLEQPQYRLIRAMFETMTTFEDSLFYDISSWTLPLAFNIPYAEVGQRSFSSNLLGEAVGGTPSLPQPGTPSRSEYAYLLEWKDFYAAKALYQLLKEDLRAKVAAEPFSLEGRRYDRGTIMIPVRNQKKSPDELFELVKKASASSGVPIIGVNSGYTTEGIDLGSNDFHPVPLPKVLLVVGDGVSSYDAGEAWHLLDQRYDMTITKGEADRLSRMDLWKYNVIVMVDGNYNALSNGVVETLKRWVQDGGVLVATEGAATWAAQKGLANIEIRKDKQEEDKQPRRPYSSLERDQGALVIGGAIFEIDIDLTHPLFYGYRRGRLPVFRQGTVFMEPARKPYATPGIYTENPLLSGYLNRKHEPLVKKSAAVVVSGIGSGRVITMSHNPNFRAFWFGTNQMFINSLFFGGTIAGNSTETQPPKKEEKKTE